MIIGNDNNEKIDFKNLMNPGIVGAVLGLMLFLLSIKLPWPLYRSLEILGSTTTPLSMIVVGSILANIDVRKMFEDLKVFWVSAIRLILLPVAVFFILRVIGFEGLLVAIPVLITAMPAAANAAIMAEKYGGDSELGSKIVFVSTMLSLLTMPLIIGLV
ncbi:MAG: Malate permease [Firmicutes bacterium]|nr:Malate permease [Bacillota bacterium]MDI6705859.1 AEC family transporter [Bacillota bacterium]